MRYFSSLALIPGLALTSALALVAVLPVHTWAGQTVSIQAEKPTARPRQHFRFTPSTFKRRFNAAMRVTDSHQLGTVVRENGPLYDVLAYRFSDRTAVCLNLDKRTGEVAQVFLMARSTGGDTRTLGLCIMGMITSIRPEYSAQECTRIVTDLMNARTPALPSKASPGAPSGPSSMGQSSRTPDGGRLVMAHDGLRYSAVHKDGTGLIFRVSPI